MIRSLAAILLLLTGCVTARRATVSTTDRQRSRVWHNSIASYYDTDGDGQVDKWVRGDTSYFDRNRDGRIDFLDQNQGGDVLRQKVDRNHDGFFDILRDGGGYSGEFTEKPIREAVPEFPPHSRLR